MTDLGKQAISLSVLYSYSVYSTLHVTYSFDWAWARIVYLPAGSPKGVSVVGSAFMQLAGFKIKGVCNLNEYDCTEFACRLYMQVSCTSQSRNFPFFLTPPQHLSKLFVRSSVEYFPKMDTATPRRENSTSVA